VRLLLRVHPRAFRGVSDSLIGYQKNREYLLAAQDAARLSELRYRGGATNYLEVLTNERNAFNAELRSGASGGVGLQRASVFVRPREMPNCHR